MYFGLQLFSPVKGDAVQYAEVGGGPTWLAEHRHCSFHSSSPKAVSKIAPELFGRSSQDRRIAMLPLHWPIHRSKCQRTEFSGNLLISEVVSGSLLGYFLEYFLGFNFFTFNFGFYSPSESSFSLKWIEN